MATIADFTTAPTGAEQAPARVHDARSRSDRGLRRVPGPHRPLTTEVSAGDRQGPRVAVLLAPLGCHDLADVLEEVTP